MNPPIQSHSGTAPETFRNMFSISQGMNEDDSQSSPHPEAGLFGDQITQNSGQEDGRDMVTRVQKESLCGHDMTGVHEEVTYYSPSSSLGEQKKKRSTNQPQFRSENTPATNEVGQILLALQQLANNNNSAISITIITEIPNCQSHLRQGCPRSTGKLKSSSGLKIFSRLNIHNQLTEEDRINYFHSLMRTMHYRHSKTLMALPERIWGKLWQFFEGII